MIDIEKLRQLAQAALTGPDGVSLNWLKLLQDFQKEASPAVIDELLDRLELTEKERDALRTLVVMRCDLDYLPQFTQGHESHEFTEPVTAEHCRWFVAEIERLRTDCDALRDKIEAMEKQEPTRDWWDALIADVSSIDCMYRGSPTYAHDAYWMRDRVEWILKQRRDHNPGAKEGEEK